MADSSDRNHARGFVYDTCAVTADLGGKREKRDMQNMNKLL
jgi:hypothetical protein